MSNERILVKRLTSPRTVSKREECFRKYVPGEPIAISLVFASSSSMIAGNSFLVKPSSSLLLSTGWKSIGLVLQRPHWKSLWIVAISALAGLRKRFGTITSNWF